MRNRSFTLFCFLKYYSFLFEEDEEVECSVSKQELTTKKFKPSLHVWRRA